MLNFLTKLISYIAYETHVKISNICVSLTNAALIFCIMYL